jgi:hypothetical protein
MSDPVSAAQLRTAVETYQRTVGDMLDGRALPGAVDYRYRELLRLAGAAGLSTPPRFAGSYDDWLQAMRYWYTEAEARLEYVLSGSREQRPTGGGRGTSAASQLPRPNPDPGKLSGPERRILRALNDDKPYQGRAVARRAGYKYNTVRGILPGMVRRGLLKHGPDGYSLA